MACIQSPTHTLADESAIEQGWDLSGRVCAGRLYMRHSDGKFVYQNNQHWALQSSVATYTRADYAALVIKYPDTELFKTYTAPYTQYTLQPSDDILHAAIRRSPWRRVRPMCTRRTSTARR
jgi:hypothetical protein